MSALVPGKFRLVRGGRAVSVFAVEASDSVSCAWCSGRLSEDDRFTWVMVRGRAGSSRREVCEPCRAVTDERPERFPQQGAGQARDRFSVGLKCGECGNTALSTRLRERTDSRWAVVQTLMCRACGDRLGYVEVRGNAQGLLGQQRTFPRI